MSLTAKGAISKVGDSVTLMIRNENAIGIFIPVSPTWAGTLTLQGTNDGTNWFAVGALGGSSTTTAGGFWPYVAVGLIGLRLIATAWTSGTASPIMSSVGAGVALPASVQCFSFIPSGAANGDTTLISASARKLWGIDAFTISAAPVYVKLYDKATAPASTDTPVHRTGVPANATSTLGSGNNKEPWTSPLPLVNGLGIRIVTGIADSDNNLVTTAQNIVNVYWSE